VMTFTDNATSFEFVGANHDAIGWHREQSTCCGAGVHGTRRQGPGGAFTDALAAELVLTDKTVRNQMTTLRKAGRVERLAGRDGWRLALTGSMTSQEMIATDDGPDNPNICNRDRDRAQHGAETVSKVRRNYIDTCTRLERFWQDS
jgi:hypothetical protein